MKMIIKIVVIIFCAFSMFGDLSEAIWTYDYVKDYEKQYITGGELDPEESNNKFIPGRDKLDNPNSFNSACVVGYLVDEATGLSAARSMYSETGIQLYFIRFEYGEEKFENEIDFKNRVTSDIENLKGYEYSIVMYSAGTDYDYKDKYYYYISDCLYYGDKVSDYLTVEDYTMIDHFLKHKHDYWDYDGRELNLWNAVAENITKGYYDVNFTTNNSVRLVRETSSFSEDSHQDIIKDYMIEIYFKLGSALIKFVVIVLVIISIVINLKRDARDREAEAKYKEAMADKLILESDVTQINSGVDDLIEKYTDDYEE